VNLAVEAAASPPAGWDAWLGAAGAGEYAASAWWTQAAARHFPAARAVWLAGRLEGRLVGGLAAVGRRRFGLERLESSVEGSPGGPVVDPTLDAATRGAVFAALVHAYARRVRGRTVSATFTLGRDAEAAHGSGLADSRIWRREEVPTALVDLNGGLDYVEAHVLSNNRRNERNRGLKRGCTLHVASDAADLAAWYPLYLEVAQDWAQAPVPLAFMQDLARARPERAFLVQVRRGGQIIGGHFCVHWGERITALYGASRRDVAKELFPATLLYWQDLVEGCARGAAAVDFGGFGGQAGLRRFKELMGTREELRAQYTFMPGPWRAVMGARQRWRRRP
jgi:CelD/BcsL family acetyltransferase involved in cellulose biosynthesis